MNKNTFKEQMREVMLLAWTFVRQCGFSMSEALTMAWRNYKLRTAMMQRIVKFYFQKVDGVTIREAYGTLKADMLPPTGESGRKPNPTVQVYYDTERHAFRCYKKANLIRIAL